MEKAHSLNREGNKFILPPSASCYFENMDIAYKNQHTAVRRLETYQGSLLHFLKSLHYRRSIEEGFSIYKSMSTGTLNPKGHLSEEEREEILPSNLVYTKSTEGTAVDLPEWIEVHYSLPTSATSRIFRLHITSKRIIFAPNDYNSTMITEVTLGIGPSGKKLIPMLPVDYRPPEELLLDSF